MTPTVYKIEFPDGRFYIGATTRFSVRKQEHMKSFRKGRAVNHGLTAAYKEYQTCTIYEVASAQSLGVLHELEAQVIRDHNPSLNVNKRPSQIRLGSPTNTKCSGVNITAICSRYSVLPCTFYARRLLGWPLLQALGVLPRERYQMKQRIIEAGGHKLTLKQWAAKTGLSLTVIYGRLSNSWAPEAVFGLAPSPRAVKFEASKPGKILASLEKKDTAAKAKLLAQQRREERIKRTKVAEERRHSRTMHTVKGVYADFDYHCSVYGIPLKTVKMRLTQGWSVDEAFTLSFGERRPWVHPPGWANKATLLHI